MNWLAFLLLLPHFKPKCINHMFPTLGLVIDGFRVLSLLAVAALFLRAFLKEKRLPALPTWLLGMMEGWICLITLLKDGDFVQACSLAVSIMALTLIVDLYSCQIKELLGALMLHFEWSVYGNLYTVLRWPDLGIVQDAEYGNMPIYFFGPDNWFMYLCIPAACVALLYLRVNWLNRRNPVCLVRSTALFVAAYACVFLQWPATAVMALAGMAAVLLISMIPGVRCCVTFPVVLVGGIAANLAIAVFRIMDTVPFLANFIQNVLKKSTTLSSRTYLWDKIGIVIDNQWFTGAGVPRTGYVVDYLWYGPTSFDHMHNIIFDLLAQGGILALLLFFGTLLVAGIPLTRLAKTPSAKIMTAAVAALLLMCIPEVCRHQLIFLLFPLAYHVGKVEDSCLCTPSQLEAVEE